MMRYSTGYLQSHSFTSPSCFSSLCLKFVGKHLPFSLPFSQIIEIPDEGEKSPSPPKKEEKMEAVSPSRDKDGGSREGETEKYESLEATSSTDKTKGE